jgi:ADP-ribose pyrophosphatase YjhB (NUDIX family)
MSMTGYAKGTSAAHEIAEIRAAVARASAAMLAWPDVLQAFKDADQLAEIGKQINTEAAAFRAYLAARLVDDRGMSPSQLAQILGLSAARVSQLVASGRKQRRSPVTDPGTLTEQPTVALAIVTSSRGVLIERRKDGIPPYTFPGGEVLVGETAAAALTRKVPAETGVRIKPVLLFGRRIHPRTGRTMVYLAAEAEDDTAEPQVLDTDDLDAVEWADLDTVRERMPDMYPPVREHLEAVFGGSKSTS